MGITLIDVERAAEKICSIGENPTIEKVRLALGSGSNSTISKYLNDWKAKQNILQELTPTTLPPDPVNAAVQQVWIQMQEKTRAEINTIQQTAQQEIACAYEKLQSALDARDHLLAQLSALEIENNQIRADKELLRIDLKSNMENNKTLHEKYDSLQKQYELLDKHSLARIEELKQQSFLLNENHQNKISDLQLLYDKAMQEFSKMHENERQKQIVVIDQIKLKEKNYIKSIKTLEDNIRQLQIELSETKSLLTFTTDEKDKIIQDNVKKEEMIASLIQWKNLEEQINSFKLHLENHFATLLNEQNKMTGNIDLKLQQAITHFFHSDLITE